MDGVEVGGGVGILIDGGVASFRAIGDENGMGRLNVNAHISYQTQTQLFSTFLSLHCVPKQGPCTYVVIYATPPHQTLQSHC